ncbi:MAG TPA: M17 family peptidase N-terminal domain-containing protein, partial [Terricaulis sp.]|nr:M17 family peptidase N-terminal domain-containing protein [Terricaulis sp.]
MDIRFAPAASGDVVAVMAGDGAALLPAAEALDKAAGGRLTKAMAAMRFTGAAGQVADVLAPEGVDFARVLVIGIGKLDAADGMAVERWAAHAVKRVLTSGAEKLVLQPDALGGVSKADAGAHAALG